MTPDGVTSARGAVDRLSPARPALPMAALAAAVLAAFAPSLAAAFVFDDFSCFVDNPHLRTLWPLSIPLTAPPDTALAGRPLVSLSFALNYALGGLQPMGYHLVNLLLHWANACLAWAVLRRTLRACRLGLSEAQAGGVALAAAAAWAVHPLTTEAVTYAAQRTELMMAAALLTTLYAVIRASSDPRRRWPRLAIAACAAGMACKEVMVVAPALVYAYDALILCRSWAEPWRRRRSLYLGLMGTWSIVAALQSTGPRRRTAGFSTGISPWSYARTQAGAILHYLRLALWPHPLVVDYDDWPLASAWSAAPAVLAIAAGAAVTAWWARRRRPIAMLGVWWFAILAPTSSVLPIVTELVAERRAYLPLLAVVVAVVWAAWRLADRSRLARRIAPALAASLVVALSLASARRNADFGSEEALWRDTLAKRPNNTRAHYNLGMALADQGRYEDAATQFGLAARLRPEYAAAHSNLGAALERLGRIDDAAAAFRRAIALDPTLAQPHNNLGHVLARRGRLREALAEFRAAVALAPDFEQAGRNLALTEAALADSARWTDRTR